MNRLLAAVPLSLLPLFACAALRAQEKDPDAVPVAEHVSISMNFRIVPADELMSHRTMAHLRSRATRQRVQAMLGTLVAKGSVVEVDGNEVEGSPRGTFAVEFHADMIGEIPGELETRILESLTQSLTESLRAPQEEERTRTTQRIAELDAKVLELEQEYVDMRRRAAAVPRAGLDTLRDMVANLERERMQSELDLRTEQSVQQPLREQIDALRGSLANMQTKVDETRARRDDVGQQVAMLSEKLAQNPKGESYDRMRAEVAKLSNLLAELDNQRERMQADLMPVAQQLEELQGELRHANSTVQRLVPRLRQLQEVVESQRKQILEAEEAEGQRDVAELRAASVRERLEAAREKTEELRSQLEELEPVRVELWK